MIYKLNNKPLSDFGAFPGRENQYFALEGMCDMPKRTGKTEYDWGTSIEPFVQAQDIAFDGRTLTLYAVMKPEKVDAYKTACVACKLLSFDYDAFNVICKDEIEVKRIGVYCVVVAKFWQNNFALKSLTVIPSASGAFRLDNFNIPKDFGIYIGSCAGVNNTSKRIEVSTTELYQKTQYRSSRDISLEGALLANNAADAYNKINQFQSALMSPGMHTLTLGGISLNVYFKDGMTVSAITDKIFQFNFKAMTI